MESNRPYSAVTESDLMEAIRLATPKAVLKSYSSPIFLCGFGFLKELANELTTEHGEFQSWEMILSDIKGGKILCSTDCKRMVIAKIKETKKYEQD